jgi:hypothetical protein
LCNNMSTTPRRRRAQAGLDRQNPDRSLISTVYVYDGTTFVGCVTAHEGTFSAFDPAGTLVGEFESQRAATRALPTISDTIGESVNTRKPGRAA